jgi:delta24-sterol reductase
MEYIPVNGQKEYCDKIRELSGAMDKDKQVREIS